MPDHASTRRSRAQCLPMPDVLSSEHVTEVLQWPLGIVMTRKAAGTRWTDCVLTLIEPIRLGGRFNSRRVRYDGRFYITHNGRNVYCDGALAWDIWDTAQHVYGVNAADDVLHNKRLKGY